MRRDHLFLSLYQNEQAINAMDLRCGRRLTTKQAGKSITKEPSNDSDHNARFCNRIGCNGRIKNGSHSQNVKFGRSNKATCSKPTLDPPSGNEVAANSLASNSLMTKSRRSNLGSRRECSSELSAHKLVSSPSKNPSTSVYKSREAAMTENGRNAAMKRNQEEESVSDRRLRRSNVASSVQKNISTLKKKVPSQNNSNATSSVRTSKPTNFHHGRSSLPSRVPGSERRIGSARTNSLQQRSHSIAGSQSSTVSSLPGRPHLIPRNIDAQQMTNVDIVAELQLAVEMMEHDVQLIQRLRVLENRLLNIYDQYWEMRMDIDDMSYEELLDLGENIGTVSTALSEEQLLTCIEIDKYQKTSSKVTGRREEADEMRCCICQEEYVTGDEIGRLAGCRHEYHATCINRWMMLKNWCPICRSTAAQPLSA